MGMFRNNAKTNKGSRVLLIDILENSCLYIQVVGDLNDPSDSVQNRNQAQSIRYRQ